MNAKNSKKIMVLLATTLLLAQTSFLQAAENLFDDWYSEQKAILAQAESAEPAEQIDLLDLTTEACVQKANDESLTLDQQALIKLLEHEVSYMRADWATCWQAYDLYLGFLQEAHDTNYAAGVVVRNGKILYFDKRFDDCLEMFEIGLLRFPNSPLTSEISLLLGRTQYNLRDYTGSKACFEKLIADFPESKFIPDAKVWLAKSLVHNNAYDRAQEVLDDVITNHPDSKAAQYSLIYKGNIYSAWQRWTDALFCYHEFFNKYPGSSYASYARKQLEEVKENMLNLLDEANFE